MIRVALTRLLLASALSALAAAPALAEPAAPSPVPAPYPNEAGQPAVAAHKHIAGVKYEDFKTGEAAAAGDAQVIEAQSLSWGTVKDGVTVYSADPMEGGQIAARTYRPGRPTYGNAKVDGVTSDPEEGGQVARAASKPSVSEISITKGTDVSSPKMMSAEPGKLEYPNATGGVAAKTNATFTTLAGKCVKGTHIKEAIITTRSASYTLHDAVVTDVTPAGDGMEMVSVSFASADR